jgi:hypothetical protein
VAARDNALAIRMLDFDAASSYLMGATTDG